MANITYRPVASAAGVRLSSEKLARRIAVFLANQTPPITTDAQLDAAIDALTATQLQVWTRAFLKALVEVVP